MRLDKYMKVSRLIKRREVAKEMIDLGYVSINDKIAKPSSEVKEGDVLLITSPSGKTMKVRIVKILLVASIKDASSMYEVMWYGYRKRD